MANIKDIRGHQSSFSDFVDEDHTHPNFMSVSTNDSREALIVRSTTTLSMQNSKKELIKHFPGIWFILLYMLILMVFESISFVLHDVLHIKVLGGVDEPFALLTVIHVAVWLITFVYDRYFYYQHNALRKCGYLMFYTKTKEIRRVPLMVFSLGNATLLLITAFLSSHKQKGWLSLIRMFQVVVSVEVLACLISNIVYLGYICVFNKAKQLPDVYSEDNVNSFTDQNIFSQEVGFREGQCMDDVLERQSEMIRYLQQHNENLGKRIIELTHPMEEHSSVNGNHSNNVLPQSPNIIRV